MKSANIARKTTVVVQEEALEALLAQRQTRDALKRRLELLDTAIENSEKEIITALEAGAVTPKGYEVEIKVTERRYPSWKSHFASVAGPEAAERVLSETEPTISKSVIVR